MSEILPLTLNAFSLDSVVYPLQSDRCLSFQCSSSFCSGKRCTSQTKTFQGQKYHGLKWIQTFWIDIVLSKFMCTKWSKETSYICRLIIALHIAVGCISFSGTQFDLNLVQINLVLVSPWLNIGSDNSYLQFNILLLNRDRVLNLGLGNMSENPNGKKSCIIFPSWSVSVFVKILNVIILWLWSTLLSSLSFD